MTIWRSTPRSRQAAPDAWNALRPGGWWFHLRRCARCGHVGCCDSSPSQRASGHVAGAHHPVVQSFEPGEDWFYHYGTDQVAEGPVLPPRRTITRSTSRCPAPPAACRPTGRSYSTDGHGRGDGDARSAGSTSSVSRSRPWTRTRSPASTPASQRACHSSPRTRTDPAGRQSVTAHAGRADQRLRTHLRRPAARQAPRDGRLDDLEECKPDHDRHPPWIGHDEDRQQDAGEEIKT